jgi:hypothetical protein
MNTPINGTLRLEPDLLDLDTPEAPDVVSAVLAAMQDDDDNQSERIWNLYEGADEAGKGILDELLICLCGYSMKSLRERAVQ